MAPSSKFPLLIMSGIQNTCRIKSPPPPRLSFPASSRALGTKMLRRKTLVTRDGDSPLRTCLQDTAKSTNMSSEARILELKTLELDVFPEWNPSYQGGLLFGCGLCWWVNISSRLICVILGPWSQLHDLCDTPELALSSPPWSTAHLLVLDAFRTEFASLWL